MTIISPHDPQDHALLFYAAADVLREEAGCSSIDIRLASLRAFLYLQFDEFSDPDGTVSEEVFEKMRAIVSGR